MPGEEAQRFALGEQARLGEVASFGFGHRRDFT
jgi:hypothetical protein